MRKRTRPGDLIRCVHTLTIYDSAISITVSSVKGYLYSDDLALVLAMSHSPNTLDCRALVLSGTKLGWVSTVMLYDATV